MSSQDEFTESDRLKHEAIKWPLSKTPRALRREVFMRVPSPYNVNSKAVNPLLV